MKTNFLPLLALLLPIDALACSCAPPQPVEDAVERALRVFHGEVVAVERLDPLSNRVTFRVAEHFKGEPARTLQVDTPVHGASCGYPFQQGVGYVVYAHGEGDWLATNSCSRTTLSGTPAADLPRLRALSGTCPAGLELHASIEDGTSTLRCVEKDKDGNILPDSRYDKFERYLFSDEAHYHAMLERLDALAFDLEAAAVPDGEPLPWSVYCVGGTCTYDAEFSARHRGH